MCTWVEFDERLCVGSFLCWFFCFWFCFWFVERLCFGSFASVFVLTLFISYALFGYFYGLFVPLFFFEVWSFYCCYNLCSFFLILSSDYVVYFENYSNYFLKKRAFENLKKLFYLLYSILFYFFRIYGIFNFNTFF